MYKAMRTLKDLGRGEMLSLAHAYLLSQQQVHKLLGVAGVDHLTEAELGDRLERLTDDELLAFLLPIVALGRGGLRRETYRDRRRP